MNKKGFTLAELLGVIVIIGLLLLLIIPLIINGTKNRENEVGEIQNEIIYEAVSEYMDLDKEKYPSIPGSIYCITIKELKEAGKLTDEVKNIIKDEEYADDYTIEVKITKDGTRKYSISEGECKPYKSEKIEFLIEPSNSKWSRDKVVTIFYPESQGECGTTATCTYKKDNGETQTVTSGNSIQVKFDKNGTIYANMEGKSEIEKTQKVEKIDIENPYIVKLELVTPWTMDYKQQINITLTDAHSGVGGYCILTEQQFKSSKYNSKKPKADDTCFKKVRFPAYGGIGTVTEFLKQDKYYIFVRDRVGNVGGYNPDNPNDPNNKKATFEVKDTTPPTCTVTAHGPLGNNGWYVGNTPVKVNPSDDYSGVRTWDLTLSSNPTYNNVTQIVQTEDTLGITYYGYVEDRAGNKNRCSLSIKKDATPPTCSTSKSNLNTTQGVTVGIGCNDNSPSSGINCPSTQYGVKASTTYTVSDGAGNTNTCSVSVTATKQYYRQTCGRYATCTSSSCCGENKTCDMWCCIQVSGPDDCKPFYTQNTVCDGGMWCRSYSTSPKTCQSSCCGCGSWNNYGWVGSYCNSVDCRVTNTRYLYS